MNYSINVMLDEYTLTLYVRLRIADTWIVTHNTVSNTHTC